MRFVNYSRRRETRLGVEDAGHIVDLVDALEPGKLSQKELNVLSETKAFIASGPTGLRLARKAVRKSRISGHGRIVRGKVRFQAPLRPEIILCSGENYWDHRDEKPQVEGREPEFFIKVPQGAIGHGTPIRLDRKVTKKLDYETELGIVIGKPGRHIPKRRALEHVFGYTIMNDVTARDRQVRIRPDGSSFYVLGPGKNFDTCAPMGPCIITADEITNPQRLQLRTLVNDEVRQNNSTAKMIWGVTDLVKFFSTYLTLLPGTVISTGTPGGTAWGTDAELGGRATKRSDITLPNSYLNPGDVVTCEIEGIGQLRNRVILNR